MTKLLAITGQSICELRVVDDFSGHAERDRLLAQHRAILHHEAHRLLITHSWRQSYGEPVVGSTANSLIASHELRAAADQPHVGRHRETEAGPHSHPIDASDDRVVAPFADCQE